VSDAFVQVSVSGGVAWMTLSEPARLNPVTLPRIREVNRSAAELSARHDVRVIVVTGAGRGFCSGADLADEELRTTETFPPASGSFLDSARVWTLASVAQPVIAMVNGAAVGFGLELALQADIRIAGQSARFALPYAQMGAVSDTGAATWIMPRLIGHARAAELLFTGNLITAAEADAIGLVNRVVPDAELRHVTGELADRVAAGVPGALRALKEMLVRGRDQTAAEHLVMQYEYMNRHRPDLDGFARAAGRKADRAKGP
jgi:enoyl-CoA hydratase/carnithine racemase